MSENPVGSRRDGLHHAIVASQGRVAEDKMQLARAIVVAVRKIHNEGRPLVL